MGRPINCFKDFEFLDQEISSSAELDYFGHHHMITNMQRTITFKIATTHDEIHLIPILITQEVTYSVHQRLNPFIEGYNLQIRSIDNLLIRMDWVKKHVVQYFHLR